MKSRENLDVLGVELRAIAAGSYTLAEVEKLLSLAPGNQAERKRLGRWLSIQSFRPVSRSRKEDQTWWVFTPLPKDGRISLNIRPLKSFNFASPEDYRRTLAAIVTLALRPLIDGPVPFIMIAADAPGAGKSLLAKLLASVVGDTVSIRLAPTSEPRWEEEIRDILKAADSRVRVYEEFQISKPCETLLAFGSSREWLSRKLHSTTVLRTPNDSTQILVLPASAVPLCDIRTRALVISLAKPNRDIAGECAFQRWQGDLRELVGDMLTNWRAQGSPIGMASADSPFSRWQEVVWGVVNAFEGRGE